MLFLDETLIQCQSKQMLLHNCIQKLHQLHTVQALAIEMWYGMNHPVFGFTSKNYGFFTQNKNIFFLPDFFFSFYFVKLHFEKQYYPEKEWQATWDVCGQTWSQSSTLLSWTLRIVPAADGDAVDRGKVTQKQLKTYPETLVSGDGWLLYNSHAQEEKHHSSWQGGVTGLGSVACSHPGRGELTWLLGHPSCPWLLAAFALTDVPNNSAPVFLHSPDLQMHFALAVWRHSEHWSSSDSNMREKPWALQSSSLSPAFSWGCVWGVPPSTTRASGGKLSSAGEEGQPASCYNRKLCTPALGNCWCLGFFYQSNMWELFNKIFLLQEPL